MSPDDLMLCALGEARRAGGEGEVPIGCVVYHGPSGQVISTGRNAREHAIDPTAHAEILALRAAALTLGHWRLIDCTVAVTLEPCPMCAGALVNARVVRLIYGCPNTKAGAVRTLYNLCDDGRLNHQIDVVAGVKAEECARLLTAFGQAQRSAGKNGKTRAR